MTKKHLSLLAAASLSVGTFAFFGYDSSLLAQAQSERSAAPGSASGSATPGSASASGRMTLPQGITRSTQSDEQGIQKALGQTVEAVLGAGGSAQQLTQQFASSDRTRLSSMQTQNLQPHIQKIKQQYQQKYNKAFDLEEQVAFSTTQFKGFEIIQGEISNPTLLSNWPVQSSQSGSTSPRPGASGSTTIDRSSSSTTEPRSETGITDPSRRAQAGGPGQPDVNLTPGAAGQSSTSTDRSSSSASGSTSLDRSSASGSASGSTSSGLSGSARTSSGGAAGARSLDRGMNVAIVTFPASHGAPELVVSLVKEGSSSSATPGSSTPGSGTRTPGSSTPGSSTPGSSTPGASTPGASSSTPGASSSSTPGASSSSSASGASSSSSSGLGASGAAAASATAGGDWKIDLPDQIDAQQLQQNLDKHLKMVADQSAQWPQDATEAQRFIAHHVLMAFYDTQGASSTPGRTTPGLGTTPGSTREPSTPGSSSSGRLGGSSGTSGSSSGTSTTPRSGSSGLSGSSGTSGSSSSSGTSGTSRDE